MKIGNPEPAHLVTLAGNPVLAGDSAKRVKQILVGDRNNHAPFLKIMTIHIRYLAALIDELSLSDQEKLAAIMRRTYVYRYDQVDKSGRHGAPHRILCLFLCD